MRIVPFLSYAARSQFFRETLVKMISHCVFLNNGVIIGNKLKLNSQIFLCK